MAKKAAKESPVRLHKILKVIRQRGSMSNAAIAAKLDVSESTVKRDIAVLTDHFECPLRYDAARRG